MTSESRTVEPASRQAPWLIVAGAPLWAALMWNVAYGMVKSNAVQQGEGDTGYAWLPLLTVPPGLIWALVTIVLLIVLAVRRDEGNEGVVMTAAITNVALVLVIFGSTGLTGSDGWPTDGASIGVLLVAAIVSVLPAVALFRYARGS